VGQWGRRRAEHSRERRHPACNEHRRCEKRFNRGFHGSRGLGIKNQNGTRTTRKPRTTRTKPFSLSSLSKQIPILFLTHLPEIFSNDPKNLFTNIQNPKLLIRVFRVIRVVRVPLFVRTYGAHCRQDACAPGPAPPSSLLTINY